MRAGTKGPQQRPWETPWLVSARGPGRASCERSGGCVGTRALGLGTGRRAVASSVGGGLEPPIAADQFAAAAVGSPDQAVAESLDQGQSPAGLGEMQKVQGAGVSVD